MIDVEQSRNLTRRAVLPAVVAVAATVGVIATAPESSSGAQGALGEGDQLRIMAPASPGGGWDQTSRAMQQALRDVVGRSEVYNVGGAGGTIGLSQFVRHEGDPSELMTFGLIMVGAVEANRAPVGLDRVTPLARLTTDEEVVVVPANSPLRTVEDLAAAMRADLGAVSVAGGSAGGVEQILAGLLAQSVGVDPSGVNYIAHSGGGEALTTVLSGRAAAAISGVSEILAQIEAGTVRPLAVASEERVPALRDVPTLRESGLDVVLSNWRGVAAPGGITPAQEQALEELIGQMVRTSTWQETLRDRGWGDAFLPGEPFRAFVDDEQRRVADVLAAIGLG
ncbi:tripartite tricarboxylate transporter substrate binding protein [Kineococcus sp. SYSU DK003]|uniref:tripartite tricarboxylate transporter substrate binding protein n=1 Tax=Kineococcus sp. SYSU DK003 TaxID=3383124 RepID=UPI003D7E9996